MNQSVEITLTVEQVNTILTVLGNQPTSSGVFPLLIDIKRQAENSVNRTAEKPAD